MEGLHQVVRWLKVRTTSSRKNKKKVTKFSAEVDLSDVNRRSFRHHLVTDGVPGPWVPLSPRHVKRTHASLQRSTSHGTPTTQTVAHRRSLPPIPADSPACSDDEGVAASPGSSIPPENDYEEIWPWDMDPTPISLPLQHTIAQDVMTHEDVVCSRDTASLLRSRQVVGDEGSTSTDVDYLYRYSCRLSDCISPLDSDEEDARGSELAAPSPVHWDSVDEGYGYDYDSPSSGGSSFYSALLSEGSLSDDYELDLKTLSTSRGGDAGSVRTAIVGWPERPETCLFPPTCPSTPSPPPRRLRPALGVSALRTKVLSSPSPVKKVMGNISTGEHIPSPIRVRKAFTPLLSRRVPPSPTPGFHVRAPSRSQANLVEDVARCRPRRADQVAFRSRGLLRTSNSEVAGTDRYMKPHRPVNLPSQNKTLHCMMKANHERQNAAFF